MIYIFIFTITALLMKAYQKNKKNIYYILSLIPIITVAAIRSIDVGIDVKVYAYPYVLRALNMSFISYIKQMLLLGGQGTELGFALITYLGAVLTKNTVGPFLLYELLIIVPTFIRIKDFDKDISLSLSAWIYLTVFYTMGLNLMRQMIAVSILFLGSRYLGQKDRYKFIFFILLASTFHFSALIAFALLIADYASIGHDKIVKQGIIILALFAFTIFYNQIFTFIINAIFSFNVAKYENFTTNQTGYLSTWNIIFKLIPIFIILLMLRLKPNSMMSVRKSKQFYNFGLLISAIAAIMYTFTLYNQNNFRFAILFDLFSVIYVPCLLKIIKKNQRIWIELCIEILYLAYWYNFNVAVDSYGVIPYTILK